MQLARDGAPFSLLCVHEACRELLQSVAASREFDVAGASLPIEPHDVRHAAQHQQQTACEPDPEHPGQASLQIRKLGHERAIGVLEPLSVPRLEFPGPVQDLLLHGYEFLGKQAFRLAPAFLGPRRENRNIESPLL